MPREELPGDSGREEGANPQNGGTCPSFYFQITRMFREGFDVYLGSTDLRVAPIFPLRGRSWPKVTEPVVEPGIEHASTFSQLSRPILIKRAG